MRILGIETSCDETAAAIVTGEGRVLSSVVFSQIAQHQPYGGVVPEIASRSHVEVLPGIVERAVSEAGIGWAEIGAVAVTRGPGLVSSLLVGMTGACALALRLDCPVVGINHLEGHLHSLLLAPDLPSEDELFPMLALLVSGGHTCLVEVRELGCYRLLGQTLDDAAGEALDKGATLLGLGYPGGPAIEKASVGGDPAFVDFPRGLGRSPGRGRDGFDRRLCFSYSGLKTALLYYLRSQPDVRESGRLADVAASYQEAVFDALIDRTGRALEMQPYHVLGCVGGVARNRRLRDKLAALAAERRVRLVLAPPSFCTDNAAMIASVAAARWRRHGVWDRQDLSICPNLPLGE